MPSDKLQEEFCRRFVPKNLAVKYINELATATRNPGESILCFSDRLKGIGSRGNLTDGVLLDMVLKSFPEEMVNSLVMMAEGLTWNSLFDTRNLWEATGLSLDSQRIVLEARKFNRKNQNTSIY